MLIRKDKSLDIELEENKKKNAAAGVKTNSAVFTDTFDDMEETMELPAFEPINLSRSVFDRNAIDNTGGINTEQSVFDKGAMNS